MADDTAPADPSRLAGPTAPLAYLNPRCADCGARLDVLWAHSLTISLAYPPDASTAGEVAVVPLCRSCFGRMPPPLRNRFWADLDWLGAARTRAGISADVCTLAFPSIRFQTPDPDLRGFVGAGLATWLTGPPPEETPMPWLWGGGFALVLEVLQLKPPERTPILEVRWPEARDVHRERRLELLGWAKPDGTADVAGAKRAMDGLRLIEALARRGPGRRRDDTDIEVAILAVAADGEPTFTRVAEYMYATPNRATPAYNSLYQRLDGRNDLPAPEVFAAIIRRVLG